MPLPHTILLLFASTLLCHPMSPGQKVPSTAWHDPSRHHTEMITVDQGVQLEVLNWGGKGRPLVFLSGLGNTAHIWDNFAPKFSGNHDVYAITRRGFGKSTHAGAGYTAERLSDDILAVMAQLKEDRKTSAGRSLDRRASS